ncbi:MAG: insulinase family protein [Alphaproteobacteria bacterium]|nr:insulinase family protein [Alphaproteobacteria bacterium]
MTIERTILDNGLTVVSHTMPHLRTVSAGVWVASGSRHERKNEHGISHLLEHMAFKGTARRSAQQIAEEIEQVGGDLNAATSLELTAYYVRVLEGDDGLAIDILSDILTAPSLNAEELEREKEVVLQEIAGFDDVPDEIAYDLVQDAAFTAQSVGRPVIGTPKSVSSFTSEDLLAILKRQYVPSRMVVSAAGAIRHDDLVRHARDKFGDLPVGKGEDGAPARFVGGVRGSRRRFGQSHMLLGFESPSYRDPRFYACQVFSGILGGGMSSRLFQEAREKRGLCYSIYSSAWGLMDGGMFNVHAATSDGQLAELRTVIIDELNRAAGERPVERELERAKAGLKAGLLMGLESSSSRAEQMARQIIGFGRLFDANELIENVEAVTAEDVRKFAESVARSENPAVAVVGCGKASTDIARRTLEQLAA